MKREMKITAERAHLMKNGQTTIKMTNFSDFEYNGREFPSPPFYTKGYKICIIVEANKELISLCTSHEG